MDRLEASRTLIQKLDLLCASLSDDELRTLVGVIDAAAKVELDPDLGDVRGFTASTFFNALSPTTAPNLCAGGSRFGDSGPLPHGDDLAMKATHWWKVRMPGQGGG